MYESFELKSETLVEDTEVSGDYIFEIIDLLNTDVKKSTETLYTNLRGIFLQNLRHDEKLGLSHEDFILFYVLKAIHPDLPVFIRDKYSQNMGKKRILDYKSEIFIDAERFIAQFNAINFQDFGKLDEDGIKTAPEGLPLDDDLKMEIETQRILEASMEFDEDYEEIWQKKVKIESQDSSFSHDEDDANFFKQEDEPIRKKERKKGSKQLIKYKRVGELLTCNHCEYTAKTRLSVRLHIDKVHKGVRNKCDICDYESHNPDNVRHHKKRVHDKVRYPCDLCDYKGTTAAYLKRHKDAKHLGIRHFCDQCPASFNTKVNLKYHIQSRHEGKGIPCEYCDFKGLFPVDLQKHIESKHMDVANREKRFLCDQCDYATNVKFSLKSHMNVHLVTEICCDQCNYKTRSEVMLLYHIDKNHGPVEHICKYCNFSTVVLEEYKAHTQTIHQDEDHPFKSKSYEKMTKHKKHMCDKCPFATDNKPYLATHMESKHGTKEYSCDQCDYTTVFHKEFKKHWKFRHEPGSSRLPCNQCHYSATRADALKRHIEVEHEGMRYPCDQCKYLATNKGDLMKHKLAIHEKIRFECHLCNNSYTQKNFLRVHQRKVHANNGQIPI